MLWWIYGLLCVWQVVWFAAAIRNKRGWIRLLLLCAASLLVSAGCTWYYNALPGYSSMVGWAYFQETIYSLLLSVVFFVTTLLAALGSLLTKK